MRKTSNEQQARQLLRHTKGRATAARIGVLSILLSSDAALSHQEIEQAAQQHNLVFDRVTLYRVLEWLVEQNIAHRVAGSGRTWRYNAQVDRAAQHAHFYCTQCEQVYCLNNLQPALLITLPPGYQMDSMELNLHGSCPSCL